MGERLTEMMWPPKPWAASAHSITALSWGYPTPVFMRVVHTEPVKYMCKNINVRCVSKKGGGIHSEAEMQPLPGPIPTLMMSAPARISSSTISPVTTFPA